MVMMLRLDVALMSSRTVASVVDLPEPVTPVTRMSPSRSLASRDGLGHAEALEGRDAAWSRRAAT
jgi:hypothetical protein